MEVVEARKQRQRDSQRDKQREAVLRALRKYPLGETIRVLREAACVAVETLQDQLSGLEEDGLVEECTVKKHTREERGYRLRTGAATGATAATLMPVAAGDGGGATRLYI